MQFETINFNFNCKKYVLKLLLLVINLKVFEIIKQNHIALKQP